MRIKGRRQWWAVFLVGVFAFPAVSMAFDGDHSGIPAQIDAYDNGLVGFRVYLPISTGMCTGSSDNWAYLIGGASPDPNYNTFVAVILTAKAQGLTLRLLTVADGAGHCHIQYITID